MSKDKIANACKYGCGFCSKYLDGDCDLETNGRQPLGCMYGNGRPIKQSEVDTDEVKVSCWNCGDDPKGCTMSALDYICWSKKCRHQY